MLIDVHLKMLKVYFNHEILIIFEIFFYLVGENTNINNLSEKCTNKEFNGKITKISDDKFILESEDCLKLLLEIKAIK
jgi:hypothetical protein